jgi:carboxymethylenebutenolidase
MDVHICAPDTAPKSAILVIQEIFGVGPYIRSVAERLADAGYLVGAPDVFWRFAPNWESDHSEAGLSASFEKVGQLDFPLAISDCVAGLGRLGEQPEPRLRRRLWGSSVAPSRGRSCQRRSELLRTYYGSGVPR